MSSEADEILNAAVTNSYEQIEFVILFLLHTHLFITILFNFIKIINLHINTSTFPGILYCVNANLILLSLLKLLTLNYAFLQSISDWTQYYNIKIYSDLCQFYIIIFNMTIMIVSNSWLNVLKIRYPRKEKLLQDLFIVQKYFNIVVTATSLITIILSIHGSSGITQFNYFVILISTTTSAIIFGISSVYFYWSIKNVITVNRNLKKVLKILNILLIFATINRIMTFAVKIFFVDLLISLKQYDADLNEDNGIVWSLLQFEYFMISDYLPLLILSIIFTPKIAIEKKTITSNSYMEFE